MSVPTLWDIVRGFCKLAWPDQNRSEATKDYLADSYSRFARKHGIPLAREMHGQAERTARRRFMGDLCAQVFFADDFR